MSSIPSVSALAIVAALLAPGAPVDRAAVEQTDVRAVSQAVARGVEIILAMQETGEPPLEGVQPRSEWPYEGVYRVERRIPIGYRVGGTSICAVALLSAPGYADDGVRREAVRRACEFVCAAADHPLMDPDYDGGYDVRGWGHCYGLAFLLRLLAMDAVPAGLEEQVPRRAKQYLAALEQIEIPQVGGWAYSRQPGRAPSPASPFMTAPVLQTLFEARRQGFAVDDAVVSRGLAALERCRAISGSFAYSAQRDASGSRDGTPGAVGRMLAAETTLLLGGRGSVERVRAALDAFIAHWDRLEERRAKQGTHAPPFGVAPYYFYFAHWHAGQAIELLPRHERAEYRRRVLELLFRTRDEEGRWNDRVFPRSAAYGTACALLTIAAEGQTLARWSEAKSTDQGPAVAVPAPPPTQDARPVGGE